MLHPVASTMDKVMDECPNKKDVSTQTSKQNAANFTYGPGVLVWKGHKQVERNVSKKSFLRLASVW